MAINGTIIHTVCEVTVIHLKNGYPTMQSWNPSFGICDVASNPCEYEQVFSVIDFLLRLLKFSMKVLSIHKRCMRTTAKVGY